MISAQFEIESLRASEIWGELGESERADEHNGQNKRDLKRQIFKSNNRMMRLEREGRRADFTGWRSRRK